MRVLLEEIFVVCEDEPSVVEGDRPSVHGCPVASDGCVVDDHVRIVFDHYAWLFLGGVVAGSARCDVYSGADSHGVVGLVVFVRHSLILAVMSSCVAAG